MAIKNKRGADKLLSVYWFAILVVIAGGVITMVYFFYGSPYDVRDMEANIMINQVTGCLSGNGMLNENLFFNKSFNEKFSILEECNLTFKSEKAFEKEGQYYLEVNFYKLDNQEKVFNLTKGNSNLQVDCQIEDEKYNRLATCVNRSFYSLDDLDNVYEINVLSIIRKTEKNVK